MSRSYKKYPKLKQERLSKVDRRFINKSNRHKYTDTALRGSQFKRVSPNWETWQYRWTWSEALDSYYRWSHLQAGYPTIESYYNFWKKCVIRK